MDIKSLDLFDKGGNRAFEITDMALSHIAEYADLFVSVFNAEPWNDSRTKETVLQRTHFQIQEFCVKTSEQNKGFGSALLQALEKALSEIGVVNRSCKYLSYNLKGRKDRGLLQ